MKLTKEQAKYLRWIDDNHIMQAGWLRNGRTAYGPPETWDQFRLNSSDSSITVSDEVHFECIPFVDVGPVDGSMFVLNAIGRAALASPNQPSQEQE